MLSVESVRGVISEGSQLFIGAFAKGGEIGGRSLRSLMDVSSPYLASISQAAAASFAFLAASFSKVSQSGAFQGRQFVAVPVALLSLAGIVAGYFFASQNFNGSVDPQPNVISGVPVVVTTS